ncbi:acetate kinase [Streptomyces sp. ME08-AFT2]|uniref:acetate/propionate family kinase n=1 Tax=Streptomyces sp. ME08-AFT2 TaxID=3028683 RepID=UPI0029BFC370|nr:acetate kinase [Streptomyces sp. ME08-AFT2]
MSADHFHESRDGHVLVLDAGSSSLHIALFAADGKRVTDRDASEPPGPATAAELRNFLSEVPTPAAIGHRIVHSGPHLTGHALIDARVRALLADVADLAPLHVTPVLPVVDAARELLPDVPHVACFDTVFHKDLPAPARTYAVPERWRAEYGLRRYGFHGLSCSWALQRTAQALRRPVDNLQVVLVHLGGGCSACAVRNGRSVDTTMGLTPLEGLVMSRRSGSLDPGALLWLQRRHGLSVDELDDTLHRHSGLLGLSGTSGDTRDLVRARAEGDAAAALALATFTLSCRRGIALMAASLDRLDALVFTGEIGEDQPRGTRGDLLGPDCSRCTRRAARPRTGRFDAGRPPTHRSGGERCPGLRGCNRRDPADRRRQAAQHAAHRGHGRHPRQRLHRAAGARGRPVARCRRPRSSSSARTWSTRTGP